MNTLLIIALGLLVTFVIIRYGFWLPRKERQRSLRLAARRSKRGYENTINPNDVDHDDPLARDVIVQAWNSGHSMMGVRDEDGKETIQRID